MYAAEGSTNDDMPSEYEHSEGGGPDENEPAMGVRPPFAETQQVGVAAGGQLHCMRQPQH